MFKKIFSQLNSWILLATAAIMLAPIWALADTATTSSTPSQTAVFDMQTIYREQIIASMATVFFNNSVFSWQGGLTRTLLAVCTIIGIFQIIARHTGTPQFLVEWAKMCVALMFALMILGGVDSSKAFPYKPVLSNGDAVQGPATLDKAVFFWLSGEFNGLASAFESYGGPAEFSYEMTQLLDNLEEFELTLRYCNPTDSSCYRKAFNYINTAPPGSAAALEKQKAAPGQVLLNKNTSQTATDENKKELKGSGLGTMVDLLIKGINSIADIIEQIIPIPFLLIKILVFLLDYLRMFLNYFTLISYALISGLSLLFAKLFTAFIVLPNQRGRVLQAYKVPLSSTMYGFLTAFITAVATVIIKSVNTATVATIIKSVDAKGIDTSGVIAILFGDSMSICAMLLIQIMAMSKIPGFARKLWDLSFEEIIDFGKAVIEAGFGVMKAVGGAALAGAAVLTGGVAAAGVSAAGGIASAGSTAASAVGGGGSIAGAAGGFLKGSASSLVGGAKAGLQATGRGLAKSVGHEPGGGLAGFLGMDDSGGGSRAKDSGSSRVTGDVKATIDNKGSHGGTGLGINNPKKSNEKDDDDDSGGSSSNSGDTGGGQSSIPRSERIQNQSQGQTANQKRMAEIYSPASIGDRVTSGVKSIGGLVGGLMASGVEQASGKPFGFSRHVSGKGAASLAFGGAELVADHAAYLLEKKEVHTKERAARQNTSNNRSDEIHDLVEQAAPAVVDTEELHSLSQTISSGHGTEEDITKHNQMVDYGDMSQLPTEIRESVESARRHESVKKWQEDKNSRLEKLMKAKDLDDNTSKSSIALHGMMKKGEIVRSDFSKHEKLEAFAQNNRKETSSKIKEKIEAARNNFEHKRTNANLNALKELQAFQDKQQASYQNSHNKVKRFDDNIKKQVIQYKEAMPELTASDIAATFNISEGRAKEYLAAVPNIPDNGQAPVIPEDSEDGNPNGVG
jgi:hypothetical protein